MPVVERLVASNTLQQHELKNFLTTASVLTFNFIFFIC
jgi:hypothetical protein